VISAPSERPACLQHFLKATIFGQQSGLTISPTGCLGLLLTDTIDHEGSKTVYHQLPLPGFAVLDQVPLEPFQFLENLLKSGFQLMPLYLKKPFWQVDNLPTNVMTR
jgi:hypothetical protein